MWQVDGRLGIATQGKVFEEKSAKKITLNLNLNIYKYFLTYVKAHGSKYDEILILAYSWSRLVHHPPWQLAPGWPNSRVQPQYGLFHR